LVNLGFDTTQSKLHKHAMKLLACLLSDLEIPVELLPGPENPRWQKVVWLLQHTVSRLIALKSPPLN
jgi:hypothetical protein